MQTITEHTPPAGAPPFAEQQAAPLILRGITWQTYESLLADLGEQSGLRLTYDQGTLEIMTLTPEHESINRYLSSLVDLLVDETGMDVHPVGSATFRREDIDRGFEPDSSFYFARAAQMRGKKRIDLSVDPAPELALEIDISHSSLDKLSVMARFGVSEVWRYDGVRVHIYVLSEGAFVPCENSSVFPTLSSATVQEFLNLSQTLMRQELKQWLREQMARHS